MSVITFENHDCVFLHVPKTGGKSVQALLGPIRSESHEWDPNVLTESLAGKWVFTVVRNPFDRFVSAWSHALRAGWTQLRDPREYLPWALDNDLPAWDPSLAEQRRANTRIDTKRHTLPQSTPCFLVGCADTAYRFEDFSAGLRDICSRLRVPYREIHVNAGRHAPWLAYYYRFPGLADLVRTWYAEDFAALGYPLDLPDVAAGCPCPRGECERHGRCEPCITNHSAAGNLPACLRGVQ